LNHLDNRHINMNKNHSKIYRLDNKGYIKAVDTMSLPVGSDASAFVGKLLSDVYPDALDCVNEALSCIKNGNSYDSFINYKDSLGDIDELLFSFTPVKIDDDYEISCQVRAKNDSYSSLDTFFNASMKQVLNGETIQLISKNICEYVITNYDASSVWVASKEYDGTIKFLASSGDINRSFVEGNIFWNDMGDAQAPYVNAARSGNKSFLDENSSAMDRISSKISNSKIVHMISFPIESQGDVVGVLQIHADKETFSPQIVNRVEDFIARLSVIFKLVRDQHNLHLLNAAITHSSNAIFVTDAKGVLQWANASFEKLSGYSLKEAVGKTPSMLKSGLHSDEFYDAMYNSINSGKIWKDEVINRHKDGALYTVEQTITPILDKAGKISHFVTIHDDLTASKHAERRIQSLANYDQLTGLLNRSSFLNHLSTAISSASRKDTLAVFLIDLMNFNRINDTLGHKAGDKILFEVSNRIKYSVPENAIISRMDGDKFAVALPKARTNNKTAEYAANLIDNITDVIFVGEHEINVGVYEGVSVYPQDGDTAEKLINAADMALQKSVVSAPNSYNFFSRELNEEIETRVVMEQELRRAIANNEFVLHYQPQVGIKNAKIVGWEALVRWQHPEKGLVPPMKFIPIAEDSGLISQIGDWVMGEAVRQLREWINEGMGECSMAVNLSAIQFQQQDIVSAIENVLACNAIEHHLLEVEITESVVMQDAQKADEILSKLSEIGVRISIDDFGTGYSSLSYLKRFPVDRLKIDRSFVSDMHVDYDDEQIAKTIINLGHSLGLEVISEGVEKNEQLRILDKQGCDIVQGYYVSKPIPAAEVMAFYKNFKLEL